MKHLAILLLGSIFLTISIQMHANPRRVLTDTVGVYSTMDGEIIYMFNEISLSNETITYYSQDNRQTIVKQKKIKWMIAYNRVFLCLPRKSNGRDLQLMEVLALSDRYMLVQYWYAWYHYFIFDYQGNVVMEGTRVKDLGDTRGATKNNGEVLNKLKHYFGDCTDLMEGMTANLENKKILSLGIANVQCEGAPPLPNIFQALNEKPWYHK